MGFEMPKVPSGTGNHPISLVVLTAKDLAESRAFYSNLFGWKVEPNSAELTGVLAPAGPMAALRSNASSGFPGTVPYIRVPDVDGMLSKVMAAGGTLERAPWDVPGVGQLARFKDPTGTIYGLTDAQAPSGYPPIPMPIGSNPKPPSGAICHIEMYAADGEVAARFFGELFGWGTLATMPQYVAFDPGAGVCGIFQSHTPSMPAVAYLYANDVGAKLTEIEAAGGRRMGEPMQMPGVGCFGYFQDQSGTSMGLIGP